MPTNDHVDTQLVASLPHRFRWEQLTHALLRIAAEYQMFGNLETA